MPARIFDRGVPPQGIRTYLVLFALALAVPLLALAIFALDRMATLEQAEIERRVMQTARDVAREIDRDIDQATATLETLATSPSLRLGDMQAFLAQASNALKRTKSAIVLIDNTYQQLVDTLKEHGAPLPPTADPETAKRVFDTKERQVSDLFRGSVSGRPVVNLEIPVIHDGAVRYVLIMSFQAAYVADLLRAAQFEAPWVLGITDNKGIIVARSERHEEFVGRPLPKELLEHSRTAKGVYRATNVAGQPILRATVRSVTTGWLVSATVPVSYLEAPRKRGMTFAATLIGVALLIGGSLAYIFGAFMARPLKAVAKVAEAVGQGASVEAVRSPLKEANTLTRTLSKAAYDLKRGREHSNYLMGELAHRAKNQLAVIKGMIVQTAKQSPSVEQFVDQLSQRIQGLATSHDLMLRENYKGAWLHDIVQVHLALFGVDHRAKLEGPDIFLNANAVHNIGFAIHELVTNASKHGALSTQEGLVLIAWQQTGDQIQLTWAESDGPPVQPPERGGFGSLLLTDLVAKALQGTSKLDLSADGLRWQLDIPAAVALSGSSHTQG